VYVSIKKLGKRLARGIVLGMVLVWRFVDCKWRVWDFRWWLVVFGADWRFCGVRWWLMVFDNKPRFQRKKKRFRYYLDVFEKRISGFDNKSPIFGNKLSNVDNKIFIFDNIWMLPAIEP
jgi:hypothetical protein